MTGPAPSAGSSAVSRFPAPTAWLLVVSGLLVLMLLAARAAPPVITKIERWNTNQVLLHFDTEAGRTYHLEYTTNLPAHGSSSATWSNLFTAPNFPFPDHYIVPDTGTNRQRFYRLRVTTP